MPSLPKRSAQDVIDNAIRENRSWEWLSYILTIALVGVAILLVGTFRGDSPVSLLSGVAVTGLALPALWSANGSRRDNIRIRLLELVIPKAKSAEEALDIIHAAFGKPRAKTGEKQ